LQRDEPSEDELFAEWQAIDARRQQVAAPLFRDLRQHFRDLAERAAEALEEGEWTLGPVPEVRQGPPDRGQQKQLSAQNVLPLSALVEKLQSIFSEHAEGLIRKGYEAATQRLNADTNFTPRDPHIQEAMANMMNAQAEGIAKTTQRRLNNQIRNGLAENESVDEIQGRVTSTLSKMADGDDDPDTDIDQSRARRIASTMTTTAFEKGQQKAFGDTGMFGQMWLSQRDTRVRSGHLGADGQTVQLGEPFEVGPTAGGSTEDLAFPGDPSGSPPNVINCRCTALPIPDQETFQEMQSEEPNLSNLPQLNEEDNG